jgi:hypothetical protein
MSFYIKCTVTFTISFFAQISAIFMIPSGLIVLTIFVIKLPRFYADVLNGVFVSVLWYRNVRSETAQGRMFLLRHKRKIVPLTVDLEHMYLLCTEMLQQWTPLYYKIWTPQQTKSRRTSNKSMFKTTHNPALCRYTVLCTETGEK